MRKRLLLTAVGLAVAGASGASHAEFALGEGTKGVNVKLNEEANLKLRIRMQPRLDIGDIYTPTSGALSGKNVSESDLYIRRTRIEASGAMTKELKYKFVLQGDKANKEGGKAGVGLKYALFDYKFADSASLLFGKTKLPYSRVSLTSSSAQLLVERPASTEAAKKLFGDYNQPILMLHGKMGVFGYAVATGDGAKETTGTTNVVESDPYYGARLTFAPMPEKGQSDAHLGEGRSLVFGVHTGVQNGQRVAGAAISTDRELVGADAAFHTGGLTAQAEYNQITENTTGLAELAPEGAYVQLGYLIPGINIEPAVRYEEYDRDSNANGKKDKITTAGFNYYLKGHSMKVGVNWVNTKLGSANFPAGGDGTRDVLQVQTQLYF